MEIIAPLAEPAAERLVRLGYGKVSVKRGDGYDGWPDHAPYDGILIKEALDHVPKPLLDQLKPGGRIDLGADRGDRHGMDPAALAREPVTIDSSRSPM